MLRPLAVAGVVLALSTVAGCTGSPGGSVGDSPAGENTGSGSGSGNGTAGDVVPVRPDRGACRQLAPRDLAADSNGTRTVPCGDAHTAQTFAVGGFPSGLARTRNPENPALVTHVVDRCTASFRRFVGAGDSRLLRTTLSWAWFRPTDEEWTEGARWWRCDVVAGSAASSSLPRLPATASGLLRGRAADRWLVCVAGSSVPGATKIPCSSPHTWRAVSTVRLGGFRQHYPGDRQVRQRTKARCSDSVAAWLHYPVAYDYSYTWFPRAAWRDGNRHAVCWARTNR